LAGSHHHHPHLFSTKPHKNNVGKQETTVTDKATTALVPLYENNAVHTIQFTMQAEATRQKRNKTVV